jgi:hypothetical protein
MEAYGGRNVYHYCLAATRANGGTTTVRMHTLLDVADNDDEATGRAMRAARRLYPPAAGWTDHWAPIRNLSVLDVVSRFDIDGIEPTTD